MAFVEDHMSAYWNGQGIFYPWDMFTFEAEKEQSGLEPVHFPGHCRIEPTRMYHATISHGEWPSLALPTAMSPLARSPG
ncbi:hypothetical protein B0T26DRAFT_683991 [Lasiosphaeria miniovina]|uniref:Uncharacterized protein n=1 Tax=Lasiosphaeria miniovina TaxID=1954250 RepID=A0AA40EDG1_9PEZI|nr:uncharacterized protein B0T26DRAFT_683991 [Lasiosphaeria miniovina]KAK0733386.1 hypothetical protein B0T26DRAFT_683991 [Lasiosphaeria miniovina]